MPYFIIKPARVDVMDYMEDYPLGIYPSDYGLDFEVEQVLLDDGIALKGYLIEAKCAHPKATILLLHGIGGVKEGYLDISAVLAEQGYNSFMYDARGHGQSGGKYCTYGAKEKHDVIAIVDHLEEKYGKHPIAIWGNSMGGAVALQAMELESRLQFGIIESTFTELRQIVRDYQKRILKIGLPWVMDTALNQAGKIASFDPDTILPGESAKHIKQPVFLAHGDQDKRIDIAYGKQIFANLPLDELKEFCMVKGAGHFDLLPIGGKAYFHKILNFMDTWVEKRSIKTSD